MWRQRPGRTRVDPVWFEPGRDDAADLDEIGGA
jgi:hypothetical protein